MEFVSDQVLSKYIFFAVSLTSLMIPQVLDEADRLLTPTFAPELSYLFDVLPKERQTCLFTATLTPSIEAVAAGPPRPGKERPFIHRMTERYVRAMPTVTRRCQ